MVYQEHPTKLVVPRALTTKMAQELAYQLVDILTLLGAPMNLQSNNGREFANNVVIKQHKGVLAHLEDRSWLAVPNTKPWVSRKS